MQDCLSLSTFGIYIRKLVVTLALTSTHVHVDVKAKLVVVKSLYYAILISVPWYGTCNNNDLKKMEKLQYRALKYVYNMYIILDFL